MARVTQPSGSGDFENSFRLLQGEQVLNQWKSEECCSPSLGNIHHTILTDRRVLIRVDQCSIWSCLCGPCGCKRNKADKAIFHEHIAEAGSSNLTFLGKLFTWIRCGCPQDAIALRGSFTNIQNRATFFSEGEKAEAQLAICEAISKANKKH